MVFKVGGPPGPGRPKGARSKLAENFLETLRASFEANGADAVEAMLRTDPVAYCKVIASILPKEIGGSEDGAPIHMQFRWADRNQEPNTEPENEPNSE